MNLKGFHPQADGHRYFSVEESGFKIVYPSYVVKNQTDEKSHAI